MLNILFPLYIFIFFASILVTAFCERRFIPYLSVRARQPIYEEGPSWHMKKSGTPTMGGLAFLFSALAIWIFSLFFLHRYGQTRSALSLSLTLGFAFLNATLGVLDDLTKLRHRRNAGLTPKEKLFFQFLFAALFLIGRYFFLGDTTVLSFSTVSVDLGFLYYPLALLLLVGFVNFANLTDGIDGLAASVAFGIGVSLFFISAHTSMEVSLLAALLMGISVGFLVFNLHPARIFMGDTGSLFLGSLVIGTCFSLGNPTLSVSLGAVYVLEGVSVILQVAVFKLTHKRVFLMAPLHHHLEKLGWSENRICLVAILMTLIFSVPAFLFYTPL